MARVGADHADRVVFVGAHLVGEGFRGVFHAHRPQGGLLQRQPYRHGRHQHGPFKLHRAESIGPTWTVARPGNEQNEKMDGEKRVDRQCGVGPDGCKRPDDGRSQRHRSG